MPDSPKANADKLTAVLNAWENLAPSATFAKMTLTQFKTAIKASLDARKEIDTLEKELARLINKRDDEDAKSLPLADKVVKAVVGDTDFGPDSSIYEAMGYVRQSERKSGLTRGKKDATKVAK